MTRLTFSQIQSITVGAIAVTQEEDGLHFQKCTQKQIDAWSNLKQDLGERAKTTTGIRLDFHTDSRKLTFSASVGNKFELYLNGVFRKQFLLNELRESGKPAEIDLTNPLQQDEAQVRVTLYLPAHENGVLEWLALDDGATVTPHRFDRKILFVGDSITQGWAASYDSFYYANRVSRFFNAESVVQGIGGAYFHESTFDSIPFDPDWVIIAYGTNDFGHYATLRELREHIAAHLGLIAQEYRGKRLIYISPIWRERQEKPMGTFRECRTALIEEAIKLGFEHIDGLSLVPADPTFFTDGLHPDNFGFSFYAESLCKQLLNE